MFTISIIHNYLNVIFIEITANFLLKPEGELRRSRRLLLGGSKKRAQFLEYSSMMQNEETLEVQTKRAPKPSTNNDINGVQEKPNSSSGQATVETSILIGCPNSDRLNQNVNGSFNFGSSSSSRCRAGTFDFANASRHYPILPPNPNFFCCFGHLHITVKLMDLLLY